MLVVSSSRVGSGPRASGIDVDIDIGGTCLSLSEKREEIETTLGDARTIHRAVDTANRARKDDVNDVFFSETAVAMSGNSSARIAERLLRGWTLTAEFCPVSTCRCPLMRERATDEEHYCAATDTFLRLGDVAHGARAVCAHEDDERIDLEDATALRDVEEEVENSFSDGEDDDDEGDDVVRGDYDKLSDGTWIADMRAEIAVLRGEDPASSSSAVKRVVGQTVSPGVASAADASSKIADKLLEGWALTNDLCPMPGCSTPLVRNRSREMFCCKHELFVRAAESVHRYASDASAGAPTTTTAPKPPPGTAAHAITLTTTTSSTLAPPSSSPHPSVVATVDAFETKLAQAREALARETDADACRRYVELIASLHQAMRDVTS